MKKILIIAGIILVSAAFFSCKKDSSPGNVNTGQNSPADTLGAWQKIDIGNPQAQINDIYFTDAKNGYACDSNAILQSTDSGKTWQHKALYDYYYNLYFYNAQFGVALGLTSCAITTNAGATWQQKPIPAAAYNAIGDIDFVSASTGFLRTQNGLFKTTDTCNTWQLVYSGSVAGLYFFDSNNGKIVTQNAAFTTADGGSTWTENGTFSVANDPTFYSVLQYTNTMTGWFNNSTNLLKTTDGGITWTPSNPAGTAIDGTSIIADIDFLDNLNGYFATSGAIFKTTDGGATWQRVCKLAIQSIIEIHFIDVNTGWACGANGLILRFKG